LPLGHASWLAPPSRVGVFARKLLAGDLASRHDYSMTPTVRRWLSASVASAILVAGVTLVIKVLHPHGPANGLAVIYILVVLTVAVRWGPAFAFVAALLSAAAFDYYFLSQRLDLASAEAVGAFLAVAIMASLLASRLRRQVREATRLAAEQEALRRIASLVAQGVSPVAVFSNVATEVGLLLGVELAIIGRHNSDGLTTVLASSGSTDAEVSVGSRWPLAEPLAAASPRRIDRPAGSVEWEAAFDPWGAAARKMEIQSSIVCPIVVDGRLWGLMFAATRTTLLPASATQCVGDFGELIAMAVRNAETQAELKASRARIVAAADETRRQIERNLHDGAQQRLVSLGLNVRAVEAIVPPGSDEVRAELARITDGLATLLDELREMSRGLHPAVLAEGGLPPALRALTRRSPVAVDLDLGVTRRLPQQTEVTAYYVVSELLTNAAKHAQASAVWIGVHAPDKVLSLTVADDGCGGADPARGSGLVGLRDRVEAIGGTISVRSPLGSGTRVDVEIPITGISGDSDEKPRDGYRL
jgi:signal transduction histidine kinase